LTFLSQNSYRDHSFHPQPGKQTSIFSWRCATGILDPMTQLAKQKLSLRTSGCVTPSTSLNTLSTSYIWPHKYSGEDKHSNMHSTGGSQPGSKMKFPESQNCIPCWISEPWPRTSMPGTGNIIPRSQGKPSNSSPSSNDRQRRSLLPQHQPTQSPLEILEFREHKLWHLQFEGEKA
jgi:hypothetical protein